MDLKEFLEREQELATQLGPEVIEEVNELVYAEPDVLAGLKAVGMARAQGRSDADELVAKNRDMIDATRNRLLVERGLITPAATEESSEAERQSTLGAIMESVGEPANDTSTAEGDKKLLQSFHLLDENSNLSQQSIESPLFSRRTQSAFQAYMSAVKSHLDMVTYMQQNGDRTSNEDADAADRIRTNAHDRVSERVATDLGIDFDIARRLVAKMRDSIEPQSSENEAYSRATRLVGKKYAEKYAGHTAWLMEDKAKSILAPDND